MEHRADEKGGQREQGRMCTEHWRQLEKASLLMVRSYSSKRLRGGGREEVEEERRWRREGGGLN